MPRAVTFCIAAFPEDPTKRSTHYRYNSNLIAVGEFCETNYNRNRCASPMTPVLLIPVTSTGLSALAHAATAGTFGVLLGGWVDDVYGPSVVCTHNPRTQCKQQHKTKSCTTVS